MVYAAIWLVLSRSVPQFVVFLTALRPVRRTGYHLLSFRRVCSGFFRDFRGPHGPVTSRPRLLNFAHFCAIRSVGSPVSTTNSNPYSCPNLWRRGPNAGPPATRCQLHGISLRRQPIHHGGHPSTAHLHTHPRHRYTVFQSHRHRPAEQVPWMPPPAALPSATRPRKPIVIIALVAHSHPVR
jgi:hypothetical protein